MATTTTTTTTTTMPAEATETPASASSSRNTPSEQSRRNETRIRAAITILLALASLSNSMTGAFWCHLLKYDAVEQVTGRFGANHTVPQDAYPTIETGMFTAVDLELLDSEAENGTVTIYYRSTCVEYGDHLNPQDDSLWMASIMMKVFAWTVTISMIFIQLLNICGCQVQYGFSLSGFGFTIAFIFEALSLMILGSDLCKDNELLNLITYFGSPVYGTCKLGDAFTYVAMAMIGFFVTSSYSSWAARAAKREQQQIEDETTTAAQEPLLSSTNNNVIS